MNCWIEKKGGPRTQNADPHQIRKQLNRLDTDRVGRAAWYARNYGSTVEGESTVEVFPVVDLLAFKLPFHSGVPVVFYCVICSIYENYGWFPACASFVIRLINITFYPRCLFLSKFCSASLWLLSLMMMTMLRKFSWWASLFFWSFMLVTSSLKSNDSVHQ